MQTISQKSYFDIIYESRYYSRTTNFKAAKCVNHIKLKFNCLNYTQDVMAKGIIIGIVVAAIAIGVILTYTNTYDVLKPEVEPVIDTTKDAISKVDGDDMVDKAGEVTDRIKDVTSKIKVNNPLDPTE